MRYRLCKALNRQVRTVDAGSKALPLLKAAYDRGLNTVSLQLWSYRIRLYYASADNTQWDTANVYSNGSSEEIIGKAIKKYNIPRHKLVICTKCCGTVRESNDPEVLALKDIDNSVDYVNQRGTLPTSAPHLTTASTSTLTKPKILPGLSRQGIFAAVNASLTRLQTPYIDLLQIHRFDKTVPIEETMKALHDLVQSGKVHYIGASSMWTYQFTMMQFCAERNGWTKFVSMQNAWNLLYREEEREMIKFCLETGVGVIPVRLKYHYIGTVSNKYRANFFLSGVPLRKATLRGR